MNIEIIKEEIERREQLVAGHKNNIVALENAKNLVHDLEEKIISFNEEKLVADIEELKEIIAYFTKDNNEQEVE